MPVHQLDVRRDGLCLAGRSVEPVVSADALLAALEREDVEALRPLLPVGYQAVANAYARTAAQITVDDLSDHYTTALEWFHDEFSPALKQRLARLTGNRWHLDDFLIFASGSDVDLMTHLVEAVAARQPVCLFPGDWYGFLVGSTQHQNIFWQLHANGHFACLCIPSVRNGHLTAEMVDFLESASSALLNLNLFPTLAEEERHAVADQLLPMLPRSILSISFSRGFGMTASQLGVFLVHRDHPCVGEFAEQWKWFTYFYNAIAARTFLEIDLESLAAVDASRREWVHRWLEERGLPVVTSGSYYVKSFQLDGPTPTRLESLTRDGLVRLCFKPPQTR